MKKTYMVNGMEIEHNRKYLIQRAHIGIEGRVLGLEEGKLLIGKGITYDLREVFLFGYENTPKYSFERDSVPVGSIWYIKALRKR